MDPNYKIIEIDTEKSLKETMFKLAGYADKFVFRGQEDSNWTLKTTLERKLEAIGSNSIDMEKYESTIVQNYEQEFPESDSTPIEIISDVQHHGGATRLIDFTQEFGIALFFAFCNFPENKASVWAISKNNLPYIGSNVIEANHGDLELFNIDFQKKMEKEKIVDFYFEDFLNGRYSSIEGLIKEKLESYPDIMKEYKIGALDILSNKKKQFSLEYQNRYGIQSVTAKYDQISPRHEYVLENLKKYFKKIDNKRLYNQRGLFLFSSNTEYSFEENLFFGEKMEEVEERINSLTNPSGEDLHFLTNLINSQRGILKINIDSSLTNFILKILKKGKYSINLPDLWGNSEELNEYTENIKLDGSSINYHTMFPDKIGFCKNLSLSLLD